MRLIVASAIFIAVCGQVQAQTPVREACGFKLGEALFAKWQEATKAGFLGCPLNSEGEATPSRQGTAGRWALFQNSPTMQGGVLVLHTSGPKAGSVFMVRGCIGAVFQALGGTGGVFGFPVREDYDVPGGLRFDFEGGYIAYDAAAGRCTPHPG